MVPFSLLVYRLCTSQTLCEKESLFLGLRVYLLAIRVKEERSSFSFGPTHTFEEGMLGAGVHSELIFLGVEGGGRELRGTFLILTTAGLAGY